MIEITISKHCALLAALTAAAIVSLSNPAAAQTVPGGCGTLRSVGQYGPYDARYDHHRLPIVLNAHFTQEIELLIKGRSGTIGGEIGYTLRAIPNYHRALIAMMRFGEKSNSEQPRDSIYTIDCWFKRAIAFAPDDAIVRMIYSTYLGKQNNLQEANAQLEIATGYAKDSPFTHYNIGLHYFEIKNYDKALASAHKAMALGWDRTELREQLRSVGQWKDPQSDAPAASASAPAQDNANAAPAK
jgi:tetratricopeptide (TPR) repeat protein